MSIHVNVQRDPTTFSLEGQRVETFLKLGMRASNALHRMLCVKVAGELLVYVFGGGGHTHGSDEYLHSSQRAVEIFQSVLGACNDVDHQVRIGAACCLGLCFSAVSTRCHIYLESLMASLCRELLRVCQDPIGTVRTEGARVLGEVIAQGLLLLERHQVNGDKTLTMLVLAELQTLMADSKLAVRMQAVWALGNLTQNLLPHRLLLLTAGAETPPARLLPQLSNAASTSVLDEKALAWEHVCSDELWGRSLQIAHTAIDTDSEKMMSASVRLLALLSCGFGEQGEVCGGARTALMLNDAATCLLKLIFGRADSIPSASMTVTVARQPTTLHPWLSKQWGVALLVTRITEHRAHLLKVLFSMCQLAGALAWRVAREHSLGLVSGHGTIGSDGVGMVLSNTYRTSVNFLLAMMQQDMWPKISQAAVRGLTLACSSYKCGIAWDQHYCQDQLLFLATGNDSSSESASPCVTMAHFLKSFELPLQIRCLEGTLLLLASFGEGLQAGVGGVVAAPVYAYWKHCSSEGGRRPRAVQPQGELALLLLLHSDLRLLRVILSSAKERWLLASSRLDGAGVGGVSREDELSMDIVSEEYARVTSILFHALPELLRRLHGLFLAEYASPAARECRLEVGAAATSSAAANNDSCVVFLDDYFQFMALVDISLSPEELMLAGVCPTGEEDTRRGRRFYGEGSQVISRRCLVGDVLEMVLEFFSLTSQTDLLSGTNMQLQGRSSASILLVASSLLDQFREDCGAAPGIACSCGSKTILGPAPPSTTAVRKGNENAQDEDEI